MFKSIIITGGSSGIGAALARAYAGEGVTIGLLGRNQERLEAVASECQAQGATVRIGIVDVTQPDSMKAWLEHFDDEHPVDLVIANAGVSGGTAGGDETLEDMQHIFRTNVDGVWHSLLPLIPRMRERGQGQIGIVASLAGYRGFPGAPAYCASKAAMKVYGEALRGYLAQDKVGVSVICPGFVKTPMTDVNDYTMPFMVTPEKAAVAIRKGLAANRARIAFPFPAAMLMWFLGLLSPALTDWIFSGLPAKPTTE